MNEQNMLKQNGNIEDIINWLNKDYNLQTFEDLTKMYLSSNVELSISKFINFQTQIFSIFGQYAPILLDLLKIDKMPVYRGKNRQVYRRLFELNKIARYNFKSVDDKMLNPERLKATIFNIDKGKGELRVLISKNDGKYLSSTMLFNDAISLATSLMHNLVIKFNAGNNSINYNLYIKLKKEYKDLENCLDGLFKEEQRDDVIESGMDQSIS